MKICQAVLKLWRRHKNCKETHTRYNQSYDSCVLHVVLWLKVCVKFHENMSSGLKVMEQTQELLTQGAITPKVGKPELQFMCSAHYLMVFNVCVKFHENMSSGFKVMEWK